MPLFYICDLIPLDNLKNHIAWPYITSSDFNPLFLCVVLGCYRLSFHISYVSVGCVLSSSLILYIPGHCGLALPLPTIVPWIQGLPSSHGMATVDLTGITTDCLKVSLFLINFSCHTFYMLRMSSL